MTKTSEFVEKCKSTNTRSSMKSKHKKGEENDTYNTYNNQIAQNQC